MKLPLQFIHERCFTPQKQQTPFVRKATPFQDVVIRCVRYAFANMPAYIGRVFFSKQVTLPFLRFRMLRHGYLRSPLPWKEVNTVSLPPKIFPSPFINVLLASPGNTKFDFQPAHSVSLKMYATSVSIGLDIDVRRNSFKGSGLR